MPNLLALDLSKTCTGFALWNETMEKPLTGSWSLGSQLTCAGRTFLALHRNLNDLYQAYPFDIVYYEEPIALGPGAHQTNRDTVFTLIGLAAHADSFFEAKNVRKYRSVNQSSWRRHFIGSMKRGTKTKQLKEYAIERCQQLGFTPQKHDEAEALGVLDYMCEMERIIPPWRANEVLRQPLGSAA